MLKQMLILCVIIFTTSLSYGDESIVALTDNKKIEVFDRAGSVISKHALSGPAIPYISMAIGDFYPEKPGKELAFLRSDQHVDIYPSPIGAPRLLRRIGYSALHGLGGRKSIAICAVNSDPDKPGDEIMALQGSEKNMSYVYVYGLAGSPKLSKRLSYFAVKSPKGVLRTISALSADRILTLTADGYLNVSDRRKNIWANTRTITLNEGLKDDAISAKSAADQLSVLLRSNSLQFFPGKTEAETIKLATSSTLTDYDIIEAVVTQLPKKKVAGSWTDGFEKGKRVCAWKSIGLDTGKIIQTRTPTGTVEALQLFSPSKTTSLELNLELPAGTNSIGLWVQSNSALSAKHQSLIKKFITFVVRVDGELRRIQAHQVDSPTTVKTGRGFHPQAHYNGWALWQVYWESTNKNATLESIEIKGGSPNNVLVSPVFAAVGAERPYAAQDVWKLKNISKQGTRITSLYYTAEKYHEYIYGKRPYLRPVLWEKYNPQEVRVIVRSTLGEPLRAFRVTGNNLQRPFMLPELPEGTYFIELSAFGPGHLFINSERMALQRLQGDLGKPLGALEQELVPCRLTNDQTEGPVGRVGEPLALTFTLSPELAGMAASCRWELTDSESVPFKQGTEKIERPGQVNLRMATPRAGAYRLTVSFTDSQGNKLYERMFSYGIAAGRKQFLRPPQGETFKEDGSALMLSSIGCYFDRGQTFRLPQETLPALINASLKGGNEIVMAMGWNMLEPIPGVYNWYLLDRKLDMGSLGGKKTWLGIGFAGDSLPEWLWYEDYIAQDNRTVNHPYHYVTPMGERFSKAHKDAYRKLFERYKSDPRVGGWFYYAGPSEGFLTDCWTRIGDYSMPAKRRFRSYLKTLYQQSLDQLNGAWKTRYTAWNDIQPPIPNFSRPWEDSPQWRDFNNFKQNFVVERLTELQSMLREIDPDRPALMYAKEGFGATGALAPIFKKYRVRYSNGGGETTMSYVQSCIMNNFDVPVTCEGHWVMPEPGSVFCVLANSILAARFAGQNIMYGGVWSKRPHDQMPATNMIMRTTKAISDIATELNATVQAGPRWAGYYSSATSLSIERQFRLGPNPTLYSIHDTAQQKLHNQESWVDDFTPTEILAKYPLIVDADSHIMTSAGIKHILSYIEKGGTLLASLSLGKYQPGQPDALYQLATHFGAEDIRLSTTSTGTATWNQANITMTKCHELARDLGRLKVIASASNGTPLMWEAQHGKGKVIFSAGNINFNKSADFLRSLIETVTGQKAPFTITADATLQAGTVENDNAYFVVIRPVIPGNNVNASIEKMNALDKVTVTISGPLPKDTGTIQECLGNASLDVDHGTIRFTATPGMLYLVKIPKTTNE